MSLHDLTSLSERPLWKAVREEVWELTWLLAVVGGLSVAGVALGAALGAG